MASTTKDIYGRSGSTLSASAALQSSLANKLRLNLPIPGSNEYSLTWNPRHMPLREPICRLQASAHRISGRGCGGLRSGLIKKDSRSLINGWPTPSVQDDNQSRMSHEAMVKEWNREKKGSNLASSAYNLTGWLTSRADESTSDFKASGKVTAVKVKDVANMTMTIRTAQGKDLAFQLGRKTSVKKGAKPAIMTMDIKAGNRVNVEYEAKGKKNIAKLVTIEVAQASKPAAKPTTTSTKKARR